MALPNEFIDNLARRVIAGTAENARTPRTQQISWHMGTVADVDPSTGTVHFAVNGSSLVIPSVRYMQTYSPLYSPAVGHIVWAQQTGTDLMVMGQHVNPDPTVTF